MPSATPSDSTLPAGPALNRRDFLVRMGLASGAVLSAAALGGLVGAAPARAAGATAGRPAELVMLDAVDLAAAIRSRQVSCREVMQAFLAHIARVNPGANAIVSLQDPEALLAQADERDRQLARGEYLGWMHGLPQAAKDLAATAGIRTTFGSPLFKDYVPKTDAIIVERAKKAGAIYIGKTNTPEFGLGSHTYNPVFGTTVNAYDPTRIAGGSSGGAAVALALRMLPVADGSDMMGSLRNPAAYNNVFGFRPSQGRVPFGPTAEVFVQQLGYEGPMARTVTDLALLLSVQAGFDPRTPLAIEQDPAVFAQSLARDFKGTRVGWLGDYGGYLPMEPGVLELCRAALKDFEAVGCTVEEAKPDFAMERVWQTWLTLRHWLVAGGLGDFYADPAKRELLKPEAQWEVEGGLKLSAVDVYKASAARSAWYQALGKLFQTYDYLLLPTAQVFPFDARVHWPKEVAGRPMDTYHRWMEVVTGVTLAGLPAISVPVGFSAAGLPMGLQVIGRPHADLAVLQLARAYEQATQWVQKRPPGALAG
ncbi:amidase [Plasticicumulans lactativorans]|uniref:Amidase n=1 Tax=Plasticicumulans lactativorans TaxID=1133106 RepID=A0A4R2LCN5_9GAMM|nr:amidase [Plasticicumulans lactativorans]TCO83355.1 amidase [Plasticicumulans lactativorans]